MNRSVAADLGSGHVQLAQRKQAAGDAEAQLAGQVESLLRDWPAGDPVVDAHWDALGAIVPSPTCFQTEFSIASVAAEKQRTAIAPGGEPSPSGGRPQPAPRSPTDDGGGTRPRKRQR